MTGRTLRQHALSLPGTHEAPHFHRTSFRVGTKIFATMTADQREAMVRVHPVERVEALLAALPDVFFSYGGWSKNGALGVRLDQIEPGLLRELVTDAWRGIAPSKTAKKRRPPAR
jgi:hypothetical protein